MAKLEVLSSTYEISATIIGLDASYAYSGRWAEFRLYDVYNNFCDGFWRDLNPGITESDTVTFEGLNESTTYVVRCVIHDIMSSDGYYDVELLPVHVSTKPDSTMPYFTDAYRDVDNPYDIVVSFTSGDSWWTDLWLAFRMILPDDVGQWFYEQIGDLEGEMSIAFNYPISAGWEFGLAFGDQGEILSNIIIDPIPYEGKVMLYEGGDAVLININAGVFPDEIVSKYFNVIVNDVLIAESYDVSSEGVVELYPIIEEGYTLENDSALDFHSQYFGYIEVQERIEIEGEKTLITVSRTPIHIITPIKRWIWTIRHRRLLENGGATIDLPHSVWNDLVDKVSEAHSEYNYQTTASHYMWNDHYATYSQTRMNNNDTILTANRYNSLKYQIGYNYNTGIPDVSSGDPVSGQDHFINLTTKLNQWIDLINKERIK